MSPLCMDAATLYTIVTLASGEHRTEAHGFPSVAFCEAAAKRQREQQSLSSKTQIYCIKHEGVAEARRRPRTRTTTAANFPF
jgi:hypothetical protein